jgi:membrane protein implicated in regulation of membrane protease activity
MQTTIHTTGRRHPGGVAGAATEVIEQAKLELKHKATTIGLAVAFGLAAALFALFMLAFALAAVAAGFATFIPWWAALLATAGILALLVGGLGLAAVRGLSRKDRGESRELSSAITHLRVEIREAVDVKAKVRAKVQLAAARLRRR